MANPLLCEEEGPVYQHRRWYEKFYVDIRRHRGGRMRKNQLMAFRAGLVGLVVAVALVAPAGPGLADEPGDTSTFVTSYDGTRLQVHLMRTDRVSADGTAPVLMIAHGFGEQGPSDPDGPRLIGAPRVRPVLDAGYHVLTWDARGHGASEGMAMFDSPDHEVRDVQAILDWVAGQPGVELDGPGDPRVGMTGASYGGMIQFLTAAIDDRIDVISPAYTAHDLARNSLATNGKFKEGWGLALAGMGGIGLVPPGLTSPLGPQLHLLDPPAVTGLVSSTAQGTVTEEFEAYLDLRSPHAYLDRIDIPTLIQGGTPDTLFPMENLTEDFTALQERRVPVKLVWNCEGHSVCLGDAAAVDEKFTTTVITWMDRWLKRDPSVDTGPQFEWIADNEGVYRSARTYPPRQQDPLRGTGAGSLFLAATAPLSSLGFVFIGGQPAAVAVDVPITAPAQPADVVGFPSLTLDYSGLALSRHTWLYAQIVDDLTGRVVGGQVTPVPVVLDGKRRSVTVDLNAIATRATPDSRYRLQIMPGSLIFGLQRSTGSVGLHQVDVALPTIANPSRPH